MAPTLNKPISELKPGDKFLATDHFDSSRVLLCNVTGTKDGIVQAKATNIEFDVEFNTLTGKNLQGFIVIASGGQDMKMALPMLCPGKFDVSYIGAIPDNTVDAIAFLKKKAEVESIAAPTRKSHLDAPRPE